MIMEDKIKVIHFISIQLDLVVLIMLFIYLSSEIRDLFIEIR